MLERQSALQSALRLQPPGLLGATDSRHAGVHLGEHRLGSLVQVTAFASCIGQAGAMLTDLVKLALPGDNRFTGDAQANLRAVGPGTWLLADAAQAAPEPAALRTALRGLATVVDLSHARTAFFLAGPAAAQTIATFCSLDITGGAFPAGSATNTRLGHIGMTLTHLDDVPTFEILVYRGYAEHAFEVLVNAGAEFGLEITG